MNRNRKQQRSEARRQFRRPATDSPRSIDVHIEELVLYGFAPGDRYRIGDAVERELARLLTERGVQSLPANSAAIEQLDGGSFKVAPGPAAQSVGIPVAQTLYQGLASPEKASTSRSEPGSETKAHRG